MNDETVLFTCMCISCDGNVIQGTHAYATNKINIEGIINISLNCYHYNIAIILQSITFHPQYNIYNRAIYKHPLTI